MNKDYVVAQALSGLGELNAMLKKMMSQMGIEDPKEAIRRINSGEWVVVSKTIPCTIDTYTVTVDETMSVEDLVKLGEFGFDNPDITTERFQSLKKGQKLDKEVFLLHFNKDMSYEAVIDQTDKFDFKSANVWDLISLAMKEPDLQRKFPIVALGSVCGLGVNRRVPCLSEGSSGRSLCLDRLIGDWGNRSHFLAVRK